MRAIASNCTMRRLCTFIISRRRRVSSNGSGCVREVCSSWAATSANMTWWLSLKRCKISPPFREVGTRRKELVTEPRRRARPFVVAGQLGAVERTGTVGCLGRQLGRNIQALPLALNVIDRPAAAGLINLTGMCCFCSVRAFRQDGRDDRKLAEKNGGGSRSLGFRGSKAMP